MNNTLVWQPAAAIATLQQRARLLAQIRQFFAERDIWEVETPLLCRTTVTAPYLHSLKVECGVIEGYLQTSPEYAMKRLLAAGSGAIYQISKAFRADEVGRLHQPEFSLLEWYQPGFTHHQLMDEVDALLQTILATPAAQRFSYAEIFQQFLSLDPHQATLTECRHCAQQQQLPINDEQLNKDDWLQLLLTHCIEPELQKIITPVFIYDFPASQAALAKIRPDAIPVAERFEVYVRGVELANGYHELTDAEEQRQRFARENAQRQQAGYPVMEMDEYLLAALPHLPACAGVALGVDRLMMLALGKNHLREVVAFTGESI